MMLYKMMDIQQGRTLVHKLCQKIPWVEDEVVDLKQVAAESKGFTVNKKQVEFLSDKINGQNWQDR